MAQTLETVIALRGRVDNSVALMGDRITLLGAQINRISQQVIRFGKDSLEVYKNYEQNMADAEAALRTGTYRDRAGELDSIMEKLNEKASEWARTTKFHTSDVSAAISEAAHAGWDYLDMLDGIPAAMLLAQAGGMDLEESLDYVVKALNATDTEFKDTNKLIDQWITGANLGATNAQEFGDAILRMGNTAMFADSTEELFTLLTVLANVGTTGSTAGTMLRNGMIRLVAPTTQARAAMEMLGATSEEIEEALSDKTISKAAQELHELGFSAFDDAGNLKPMLQVFKELDQVTAGLSEQRRDQLLSAIFPMRSITGALAILEASKENYGDLYEMIRNSEGAAQIASDIQMDTLEGRMEIFKSKWEELKRITGERLAPKLEGVMDSLGGFIDSLSTMDQEKFDGLLSAFTIIAGAGPALMLLGGALKLIGSLGAAGWIGVTAAGLFGVATYVDKINNSKFKDNFGNMNWDTSGVKSYINEIGKEFDEALTEIDKFRSGVEEAAETYRTSSESLSGVLLTHYLTKTDFTDADKQKINQLADQMYTSLDGAIKERAAQDMSTIAWLFDSDNTDENYVDIIDLFYANYTESEAEARLIGENLKSALTDAFTDGMTEEEYNRILEYMRQYNEAMSRAASEAKSEEEYIEYQKMLYKSQNASFDDINNIINTATDRRDKQLQEWEDTYLETRFRAITIGGFDESDEQVKAMDREWEQKKNDITSQYDDIIYSLWDSALSSSDYSDVYKYAKEQANLFRSGSISSVEAVENVRNKYGKSRKAGDKVGLFDKEYWTTSKREELGELMFKILNDYGGYKRATELYNYHLEKSKTESDPEKAEQERRAAEALGNIILMEGILNNFKALSLVDGDVKATGYDRFGNNVGLGSNAFLDIDHSYQLKEKIKTKMQSNVEEEVQDAQKYLDLNPGHWYVISEIRESLSGNMHGGNGGKYANGGRATEPSIFGEAGAEWAIPEEHSDRTAALLDAAREASGFSWPELIDRNGGMNANAENVPTTLVYSPTIYANDASGVEEKLREDKKDLEKWWRNRQMEGDVAAYG